MISWKCWTKWTCAEITQIVGGWQFWRQIFLWLLWVFNEVSARWWWIISLNIFNKKIKDLLNNSFYNSRTIFKKFTLNIKIFGGLLQLLTTQITRNNLHQITITHRNHKPAQPYLMVIRGQDAARNALVNDFRYSTRFAPQKIIR